MYCGHVVYMSQWYNYLSKQDIIYVSMMSGIERFPKQLTAGKFQELSIKTIANVSSIVIFYI